jgi:hypothetical protein
MNPQLYKLLLELDRREFVSDNYFAWPELEKRKLTEDLITFFTPIIEMGGVHRESLVIGLIRCIEEGEELEDYEQADILHRCLRGLVEIKKPSMFG